MLLRCAAFVLGLMTCGNSFGHDSVILCSSNSFLLFLRLFQPFSITLATFNFRKCGPLRCTPIFLSGLVLSNKRVG